MNNNRIIKVFTSDEVARIMGDYVHDKLFLEGYYSATTMCAILEGKYVLRVELVKVEKEMA